MWRKKWLLWRRKAIDKLSVPIGIISGLTAAAAWGSWGVFRVLGVAFDQDSELTADVGTYA